MKSLCFQRCIVATSIGLIMDEEKKKWTNKGVTSASQYCGIDGPLIGQISGVLRCVITTRNSISFSFLCFTILSSFPVSAAAVSQYSNSHGLSM